MPNQDQSTPMNHSPESELGWLLQPTWEKDLFGEIADAKRMTPELLHAFEEALTESEKGPPLLASTCSQLTNCGTFEGSCGNLTGPGTPCPNLKECDKFTGTAIVGGTKGTKIGTTKTGIIKKSQN